MILDFDYLTAKQIEYRNRLRAIYGNATLSDLYIAIDNKSSNSDWFAVACLLELLAVD